MDISIIPIELAMKRSEVLVIAMVGKEAGIKWWDSPNKAFDMKTPNQQWREDYLKVYYYLMDNAYGR